MANIYISFLGTNDYLSCTYHYKSRSPVEGIRFVQEATLSTFCRDWSPEDRVVIFTTKDAYNKNWLDNGHVDHKTGDVIKCEGFKKRVDGLRLSPPVKNIEIPDGKSKQELWEIFQKVFDCLKDQDEVVFDVTHAFRSIPIIAMVVISYAKVMKRVTLRGVYYGAFEALGTRREAEQLPPEKRIAPILDLTPLNELMEWSVAIDRFKESGDASQVNMLARSGVESILRETKGRDDSAKVIKKIGGTLGAFSKTMATCRGQNISKVARALKEEMDKCGNIELVPAFVPLFDLIKKQMSGFGRDEITDGIEAARWCFRHNLIQQAYTILQETLISYLVLQVKGDPEDVGKRNIASQAVKIKSDSLPENKWNDPAGSDKEMTRQFLKVLKNNVKLHRVLARLTEYRNDLNHAGHKDGAMDPSKFEGKMSEVLQVVEAHL